MHDTLTWHLHPHWQWCQSLSFPIEYPEELGVSEITLETAYKYFTEDASSAYISPQGYILATFYLPCKNNQVEMCPI